MLSESRLVKAVEYLKDRKAVKLTLTDDAELTVPVSRLQFDGIQTRPTDDQLANVKVWGAGITIYFPELSEVLFLEDLIEGIYGDQDWMESLKSVVV